MNSNQIHLLRAGSGVITAAMLAACGGAPSEAEFIAACMKEGESIAQKGRDRQMGVERDIFCKCATREAKATYSADGQRATILGMQGKKEEARAITAKMSDSDQKAHLMAGLTVMAKCVPAAK